MGKYRPAVSVFKLASDSQDPLENYFVFNSFK